MCVCAQQCPSAPHRECARAPPHQWRRSWHTLLRCFYAVFLPRMCAVTSARVQVVTAAPCLLILHLLLFLYLSSLLCVCGNSWSICLYVYMDLVYFSMCIHFICDISDLQPARPSICNIIYVRVASTKRPPNATHLLYTRTFCCPCPCPLSFRQHCRPRQVQQPASEHASFSVPPPSQ
jgi:hypothetical protein